MSEIVEIIDILENKIKNLLRKIDHLEQTKLRIKSGITKIYSFHTKSIQRD
jgi:restriction endonuclease S subunit